MNLILHDPQTRSFRAGLASLVLLGALAGCGAGSSASGGSGGAEPGTAARPVGRHLAIVAGENFWGSIATQLAGDGGTVLSVLSDPNADPHDYETSADDAKAFANADYVVVNGGGYDNWADKLLDANAHDGRHVLHVNELLGSRQGDNPHFWYSPAYVGRVADRIAADLTALDPQDAAYFAARRSALDAALAPLATKVATIRAHYSGTAVAATENIVVYLTEALGLTLISPVEFMQAVAEGNDPPAQSVAAFQQQLQGRAMKVLLYNAQTVTPVTGNLKATAARGGIPTVAVTETIVPDGASYQDWQNGQLDALAAALAATAGPSQSARAPGSTPAVTP